MQPKRIFVVPIEPIDQRYTKQWYDFIPQWLSTETGFEVITIGGFVTADINKTTAGAFLDFGMTNAYKASQVQVIAQMFTSGTIKAGDHILVTDAWNFAVTAIKYMSELLDIPVTLHGIWHAGNYDPSDILGMKMSRDWASNQERSWFLACDYNYYASNFHRKMFLRNIFGSEFASRYDNKAIRSGQPHGLIVDFMAKLPKVKKENIIMWPHRYNADKQPEIAEDIGKEFNVVITQKMNLNKAEYYQMMMRSKMIFSCALHENLGISMMEGTLAGAYPLMPKRCSYEEMYSDAFLYPSEWTSSWENYQINRDALMNRITNCFAEVATQTMQDKLFQQREHLKEHYLNAGEMLKRFV